MKNVFEGIQLDSLSKEESVELLRQIKTAQAQLMSYDVKPNYRKSDLLFTAKALLGIEKTYHTSEVQDAMINIADFCTDNYKTTKTGRKQKEAYVAYEKKDKYLTVLSGILAVLKEHAPEDE